MQIKGETKTPKRVRVRAGLDTGVEADKLAYSKRVLVEGGWNVGVLAFAWPW